MWIAIREFIKAQILNRVMELIQKYMKKGGE